MLNDITLGQYFPGNSPVHRLDPRTKILLTIVLIILIFALTNFFSYGVLFFFLVLIILTANLSTLHLMRSVKPLWPILLITMLVHTFSVTESGYVLGEFFIFKVTQEGLMHGLLMITRLIFLILFSSVLTMTTSPLELTDGLEKLLRPFKKIGLPAHELAMMMTIALRFIPTLLAETQRIMMAQSARGADFKSGTLVKKAKNLLSIIVPLFLSAFRRADELATAMEARCYRGGEGRTRMYQLAFSKLDGVAVLLVSLIGSLMLAAKWYI